MGRVIVINTFITQLIVLGLWKKKLLLMKCYCFSLLYIAINCISVAFGQKWQTFHIFLIFHRLNHFYKDTQQMIHIAAAPTFTFEKQGTVNTVNTLFSWLMAHSYSVLKNLSDYFTTDQHIYDLAKSFQHYILLYLQLTWRHLYKQAVYLHLDGRARSKRCTYCWIERDSVLRLHHES